MILAIVEDLLFRSRIREVAKQVGAAVQFPKTAGEAIETARARPALAIVDLHANGLDPLAVLAVLRAEGVSSIGFFAHVQTDLARAALEAGATQVMPRSAFAMRLREILTDAENGGDGGSGVHNGGAGRTET